MRLHLVLLAATLLAAAGTTAAGNTRSVEELAMALLPTTFGVQSIGEGPPPPAPASKLPDFCALMLAVTPDACSSSGSSGAVTRSLCSVCGAPSPHRALLQQGGTEVLEPCSQVKDKSNMCSFFLKQAQGACTTQGFLSVFMSLQCRSTCQRCQPDGAPTPPAPVASPAAPTCLTAPNTGAACSFFFATLANPCTLETAGDSFIAEWTTKNCQTSCGICADGTPASLPAVEEPTFLPSVEEPAAEPPASNANEPAALPATEKPASPPTAEEPASPPNAEDPASPAIKEPASPPTVEEPASPPAEEPASPPTEQPIKEPTAEEPDSPPTAEEPASPPAAQEPAAEEPASPPDADDPASPPDVEEPASPPTAEEPASSPTAEEPSTDLSPAAPTAPSGCPSTLDYEYGFGQGYAQGWAAGQAAPTAASAAAAEGTSGRRLMADGGAAQASTAAVQSTLTSAFLAGVTVACAIMASVAALTQLLKQRPTALPL